MRGHSGLRCCRALLGLAGILPAQQGALTSHPQDSIQNGNGNLAPFGVQPTAQAAEARSQILVRASELPGPGAVLVGLEVHAQADASLIYQSLRLRVGNTTLAALSSNLVANAQTAQTVLNAGNVVVNYTVANWTRIAFATPFVHDGVSSLVIDVQKVVDLQTLPLVVMDVPSPPTRTDLPRMMYAIGGPGSGASTATGALLSADPICVRLVWNGAPTLRHRSDLGASGNHYAIGTPIDVTLTTTAGSPFLLGFDVAFLAAPVTVPGVTGVLHVAPPIARLGSATAGGVASWTLPIPADPFLVGVNVVFQGGVLDLANGLARWTNACDGFVAP